MENISWLDEEGILEGSDRNQQLVQVFNSFRSAVSIPKDQFLYLSEYELCPLYQTGQFVQRLIEFIDLTRINVFIWATTAMEHTSESGPWNKIKYQVGEGDDFCKIRQLAQYLNIPAENVLYLVPEDDFLKEKLAEYVGHLIGKIQNDKPLIMTWFEVSDRYYPRQLQRMLHH